MAGDLEQIDLTALPGRIAEIAAAVDIPTQNQQLHKVLQQLALSGVHDHFVQSKDPDGKPWPPLAHPRPQGGDVPLRNTGLLMASVTSTTQANADSLLVVVQSNRQGARLMNEGGTVTAKRGKFLAIPLTVVAARVDSPRNFPGALTFVGRPGGKTGALVDEAGESQYALVHSVLVPARRFLGFSAKTIDRMVRAVVDLMSRRIKRNASA